MCTMIEKITKDRAWRGATVRKGKAGGRPVYLLSHPSGATAMVYRDAGDMEARAWRAWAWRQEQERRRTQTWGK